MTVFLTFNVFNIDKLININQSSIHSFLFLLNVDNNFQMNEIFSLLYIVDNLLVCFTTNSEHL